MPKLIKRMHLNKGQALFKYEKPKHLILFSQYYNREQKQPDIFLKRVVLDVAGKSEKQLSEDITKIIEKYKHRLVGKETLTEDMIIGTRNLEKSNKKQRGNGAMNDELIIDINRPTLLITGSGSLNTKFVKNYIRPKFPSTELDPNCHNVRLWDEDRIIGWYSDYWHDIDSSYSGKYESLYFYEYETATKVETPEKALNFDGAFDPGNGNGGGVGFP